MKSNLPLSMLPVILTGLVMGSCLGNGKEDSQNNRPNIIILLADDQGYGDVSYHKIHPHEVSTPGIDQLASEGVIFTNGYASAYVCAPTRAGLLTGRYQQRFGFYTAGDSREGMPLDEITLADILKDNGYTTGIFGKWHLGLEAPFRPLNRGFDNFYGFLGHGAHDYFELDCDPGDLHNCIYRDSVIIHDTGYLTDNLAREAIGFIEENSSGNPFFLYLAFNAVHWPLQAPEVDIAKFSNENPDRNVYLAMLHRMDIAVDNVINSLKENGLYENSLIFYLSDNGGAKKVSADNIPLRDFKQSTYEGGIRVPFVVSWPQYFEHRKIDEPVISLDIMPTICDVLNIEPTEERLIDGKSMLPLLEERQDGPLHEYLYWDGDQDRWAVRNGKWKLVKNNRGDIELYDLDNDISEGLNLAEQYPDIYDNLQLKYNEWRSEMGDPMGK
ncbi:MAG: sulfatase-like hydrolase/transferase [Bacteroidales bacterium]